MSKNNKQKQLEGIAEATRGMLFGQDVANAGRYAYLNGGGMKFDEFIRLTENYLTFWKECEILSEQAKTIASELSDVKHAVIVGQGSAFEDKEWHVLKELPNLEAITFIDLAEKFNQAALKTVNDNKHEMKSKNVTATAITGPFQEIDKKVLDRWNKDYDKNLVMCVGSLITNIEKIAKDSYPETETYNELKQLFRLACNDGYALIGYNGLEKQSTLQKAYANKLLAEFMQNAWHFMVMNTPDLRIEDINGNVLDKNDRQVIDDLFTYEIDDPKFDPATRNYAHIIKAKKSFKVYCKDENSQDGEHDEICKDIEAGHSFTMMNSYQASTSIINSLVKNISQTAKAYDVNEVIVRGKDNIYLHSFKISPNNEQKPA